MTTPQERRKALVELMNERVLVIDGAMGTMIHQAPLSIDVDYLGRENCPEILNVTRPDVIKGIHRQYLEAAPTLSKPILSAEPASPLPTIASKSAPTS